MPLTRFRSSSSARSTRRSARADLVNGLGREVDRIVGQRAATEVHEGREPGEARRFGASARLMRGLDRDAPSAPSQFPGKYLVEQVGGRSDPADRLQLGQLGLDAGEARATRIATRLEEERGGRSRMSVAVRTARRVALGLRRHFQAGAGLGRRTGSNAGEKPFLVGGDRRAARSARHGPPPAVRSPAHGSAPPAAPSGDRGPRRPPPPDRGASLRAPRRRRRSLPESRTGRGPRRDGVRPSGLTGSAHGPRAPGRGLAARSRGPSADRSPSRPPGTGRTRGRTAARRRSPAGWPGPWPRSGRDRPASASTARRGAIPRGRSLKIPWCGRFGAKLTFDGRCILLKETRGGHGNSWGSDGFNVAAEGAKCQKWLGGRH